MLQPMRRLYAWIFSIGAWETRIIVASRAFQMRDDAVDRVGDRRVDRAPGLVGRPEHEVVDEELGSPIEQLGE
jgi:hypothetical protein